MGQVDRDKRPFVLLALWVAATALAISFAPGVQLPLWIMLIVPIGFLSWYAYRPATSGQRTAALLGLAVLAVAIGAAALNELLLSLRLIPTDTFPQLLLAGVLVTIAWQICRRARELLRRRSRG